MVVAIARSADEWEALASHSFVPLVCDVMAPAFLGSIDTLRLTNAVSISSVRSEATVVTRTPRLAASSDTDSLHLSLQLHSKGRISQGGKTVEVPPGSLAIYETNKPYRLDYSEPNQGQIVVRMSRTSLGLSARLIADACGRIIVQESSPKKVFFSYVSSLAQQGVDFTEIDSGDFSRVATELAATMIAASYAGDAVVPGSPYALMVTIQSFIRENLISQDLTLDAIAHEHFISRRKLYDLFSQIDTTPAAFLRQERLKFAARMISAPDANGQTITGIAYACGFMDTTTFTRAFRKQFGCSPSEWRHRNTERGRGVAAS